VKVLKRLGIGVLRSRVQELGLRAENLEKGCGRKMQEG
jgi:hypothetical protein